MAATVLARYVHVDLYERNPPCGPQVLVAGAGGLNITNQAEGEGCCGTMLRERLAPMLRRSPA